MRVSGAACLRLLARVVLPALLRGADCGRCTTELKLPRPLVAWTLCERIERAESASALPVLAPERPASMVY